MNTSEKLSIKTFLGEIFYNGKRDKWAKRMEKSFTKTSLKAKIFNATPKFPFGNFKLHLSK